MKPGICRLSLIPVRKDPSEKSEMVSQLLFGETFRVDEKAGEWYHITTEYDNYNGWIDKKMFSEASEDYYLKLKQDSCIINNFPVIKLAIPGNGHLLVPAGSTLGNLAEGKFIELDGIRYRLANSTIKRIINKNDSIIRTALKFMHAPYLWGGRSSFGFDCSGFIQIIYKIHGTRLPRDAWQQASVGQIVKEVKDICEGDLVFFSDAGNNIIHVGIALSNSKIIHCSGMVRIDNLDQHGIFNVDLKSYTHHLHSIRRVKTD
jgi:hypothetical protein